MPCLHKEEGCTTRGLLLVQLPHLPNTPETMNWLILLGVGAVTNATWYTDGSFLDSQGGFTAILGRVGVGVLAVGEAKAILAAGFGTPPQ